VLTAAATCFRFRAVLPGVLRLRLLVGVSFTADVSSVRGTAAAAASVVADTAKENLSLVLVHIAFKSKVQNFYYLSMPDSISRH
jgi:hypothetical protein